MFSRIVDSHLRTLVFRGKATGLDCYEHASRPVIRLPLWRHHYPREQVLLMVSQTGYAFSQHLLDDPS